MADLALEFGASVPTVRKAFEILEAEHLLVRKRGGGVLVTGPKKRGPVALLCDMDLSRLSDARSRLKDIRHCQNYFEQKNIEVRVYLGSQEPSEFSDRLSCRQLLRDIRNGEPSAILPLLAKPGREWLDAAQERGIPVVGLCEGYDFYAKYDFNAFGRKALEVVRALSLSRAGFIGMRYAGNPTAANRIPRVTAMFEEANIRSHPSWIREDWHASIAGAGWSSFRDLWTSQDEKPQAVIVENPALIQGVVTAANESRLSIGKDICIIAATPKHPFFPTPDEVVRVEADNTLIVEHACSMLLSLMQGHVPKRHHQLLDVWEVVYKADAPAVEPDAAMHPEFAV